MWPSTAVAHLLQGFTCVLRDALLDTWVFVLIFSYYCFSISSKKSGDSPIDHRTLSTLGKNALALTGHFYVEKCCSPDIFS